MARKRSHKRPTSMKASPNLQKERRKSSSDKGKIRLVSYNIVYDKMEESPLLPPEVEAETENLYNWIHNRPRKAIRYLEPLREKYPDVPLLYNWLTLAYAHAGKNEEVERLTRENYKKNPDYLFAKLNYAERCLRRGETEKIPEIFGHNYDLRMLYPDRDAFHVSEVAGFMGIMGWYFYKTGDLDRAAMYYDILEQVDPDHPFTDRLAGLLLMAALDGLIEP